MDSAGHPKVAVLFPSQYAEAAAVLGRAFVDDPLFLALIGNVADSRARATHMARLFSVMLTEQRRSGQPVLGVLNDGKVGAAAIIEQVDRLPSFSATLIRGLTLMPDLIRAVGFRGHFRAISTLDTLLQNRPPRAPHLP
jgi:hypothetical protein